MKLFIYLILSFFFVTTGWATSQRVIQADVIEGVKTEYDLLGNKGNFERNFNGWTFFDDDATVTDLTGGTASNTCARSTSSPLSGDGSMLITPVADQGEGCAIAFTVDTKHQAKVLTIEFEYSIGTPASYTDGDYQVYIYDVTNSQLIQPASYKIYKISSGTAKWKGEFQTSSSGTSYRLGFYQSTTSTGYTIKIDDLKISRPQIVNGVPWTDEVSFTPTGSWVSNTTYTGSWHREGQYAVIQYYWTVSGAPTSASLTLNMPSGLTMDTNVIPIAFGNRHVCTGNVNDAGVDEYPAIGYAASSTTFSVHAPRAIAIGSGTYQDYPAVTQAVPQTWASTDSGRLTCRVPISGWSTSVAMSDVRRTSPTIQTFTSGSGTYTTPAGVKYLKVYAVGGGGGGSGSGTGGTAGAGGNGGNTTFGTSLITANGGTGHSGDGGVGGGTASVSSPAVQILAATGGNGTGRGINATGGYLIGAPGGATCFGGNGGGGGGNTSGVAGSANTGGGGGGAPSGGTGGSYAGGGGGAGGCAIAIINGPSATYSYSVGGAGTAGTAGTSGHGGTAGGSGVIIVEEYYWSDGTSAASETVSASYSTATAGSYANDSVFRVIDYGTKAWDSHGAVTTGASWKFTAPISGTYEIKASILTDAATWTASDAGNLRLYKNGSAVTPGGNFARFQCQTTLSQYADLHGSLSVKLLAGEYIDVRFSHARTGGSVGLLTDAITNYIMIDRVGNY